MGFGFFERDNLMDEGEVDDIGGFRFPVSEVDVGAKCPWLRERWFFRDSSLCLVGLKCFDWKYGVLCFCENCVDALSELFTIFVIQKLRNFDRCRGALTVTLARTKN